MEMTAEIRDWSSNWPRSSDSDVGPTTTWILDQHTLSKNNTFVTPEIVRIRVCEFSNLRERLRQGCMTPCFETSFNTPMICSSLNRLFRIVNCPSECYIQKTHISTGLLPGEQLTCPHNKCQATFLPFHSLVEIVVDQVWTLVAETQGIRYQRFSGGL